MDFPRQPGAGAGAPGLAPRRAFTTPISSAPRPALPTQSADGLVETLYTHDSVKIVAFTAGPRSIPVASGRGITSAVEIEPGSLAWSSQFERTIAVGPFRIYRAPGSVAFLSCGSALQPILPKSQCWCVDEQSSKFVLQVRRPQYWRIEIPVVNDEDMRRTRLLRDVLDKVLQFEKTECPFKRTFTVVLPQRPQAPVKKRPWTPVRKPCVVLPPTPITLGEAKPLPKTDTVAGEKPVPDNSDGPEDLAKDVDTECPKAAVEPATEETSPKHNDYLEGESTATDREESEDGADDIPVHVEKTRVLLSKQLRPYSFQATRSFTLPPHLTLATSPPSKSANEASCVLLSAGSRSQSPTGSPDSFHSVQAWHSPLTPLPPSPPISDPSSPMAFPYSHENISLPKRPSSQGMTPSSTTPQPEIHHTSLSEVELSSTGSVEREEEDFRQDYSPDSKASTTESSSIQTPSAATTATRRPRIRHRATTSSSISPNRRPLSPLPSAANLFTPRQPFALAAKNNNNGSSAGGGKLAVVRQLPMAVIHKTCEILLSPPNHLLHLMLKVAARITAGQWRGFVFGTGERGERIPVRWDWSDGDDDGHGELGGWGADDDWPVTSVAAASSSSSTVRDARDSQLQQRRRQRKEKMVGSFPSDDEDEDEPQRGDESQSGEMQSVSRDTHLDESEVNGDTDANWARSWGVD